MTDPAIQPVPTRPVEPVAAGTAIDPALSVVLPIHNEAENIQPLLAEIYAALSGRTAFEAICVDDGSTDDTFERLRAAKQTHPSLRLVRHRTQCGQSTAVRTGVKRSRAAWVVTLDADGQNDPADIPRLLDAVGDATSAPDLQLLIRPLRT